MLIKNSLVFSMSRLMIIHGRYNNLYKNITENLVENITFNYVVCDNIFSTEI